MFYNNCAFTKEFLLDTLEDKYKKIVKAKLRDLIIIWGKKSIEKVSYSTSLDDEWFAMFMNKLLSEEDLRKFKNYLRQSFLKNQMNCEIDKENMLIFFSDWINALV